MVWGMGMETMKVGERGMGMVHVEGMRLVKVVGTVLVKVRIPNVELSLGGDRFYWKEGIGLT